MLTALYETVGTIHEHLLRGMGYDNVGGHDEAIGTRSNFAASGGLGSDTTARSDKPNGFISDEPYHSASTPQPELGAHHGSTRNRIKKTIQSYARKRTANKDVSYFDEAYELEDLAKSATDLSERELIRQSAVVLPNGEGADTLWFLARSVTNKSEHIALRKAAAALPHGRGCDTLWALTNIHRDPLDRAALQIAVKTLPRNKQAYMRWFLAESATDAEEREEIYREAVRLPDGQGASILEALSRWAIDPEERMQLQTQACLAAMARPNNEGESVLRRLDEIRD